MVFSNLFFIYLFLPLNLILYFVVKNRTWQNIVLLGFSLFFYAWGEPVWVFMLRAHRLFGLHLGQVHRIFPAERPDPAGEDCAGGFAHLRFGDAGRL